MEDCVKDRQRPWDTTSRAIYGFTPIIGGYTLPPLGKQVKPH